MHSKRSIAAIIGAILIIGAASSPLARATPPDDACSLLTQAQVGAVLGVLVATGQRVTPASAMMCGWSVSGGPTIGGKKVVLDIFGPIGKLTPADRFTNGKTPVQGITKTPISGIGDDAYYITTPGLGTGLNVKKGSIAFQVRVYGFSLDQIKAMEKTLAEDTLAKL
jgi:hypothetical protein